jgi:hypothetical protein
MSQAIRPRQRAPYVFCKNTIRERSRPWHVPAWRSLFPVGRFRKNGKSEDQGREYSSMSSRIPSDEQVVIAWFRDYLIGLASVGIRLDLTATQQSELEHRLLAVCQRPGKVIAARRGPKSRAVVHRRSDPIENRWLDDHVSVQGETWPKT